MSIIDAHHHFWDPARRDYPWLGASLAPINRSFDPRDLRPSLEESGVVATILVQTVSSSIETDEFLDLAERTQFVAGVVGWTDLTSPDIADALAAIQERPSSPLLIGLRHQVENEPDASWLCRPDVLRGLAAVRDANLIYDLLVRPRELPAALAVVRRLEALRFVVDHVGKPRIGAGPRDEEWEGGLRALAGCENVACKLSGLTTEANWAAWQTSDLEPYVTRALEWFGPDRLMWGSDWPVCLLAGAYETTLGVCQELLAALSPAERDQVFRRTACSWYGIGQFASAQPD